jgi:hypothetical protein
MFSPPHEESDLSAFSSDVTQTHFGSVVGHTAAWISKALNKLESYYNNSVTKEQSEIINNLYTFVHDKIPTPNYESLNGIIDSNDLLISIQKLFDIERDRMGRSEEAFIVSGPRAVWFLYELLTTDYPDFTFVNYTKDNVSAMMNITPEVLNQKLRNTLELRNNFNEHVNQYRGGKRRKKSRKSKKSKRSRKSKRSKKSRRR